MHVSRETALSVFVLVIAALALSCSSEKTSGLEPDTTAPAAVTTLEVQSTGCDNVTLAWIAVGDDSTEGKAAAYDVRYAKATITEATWAGASACEGEPAPKNAGSTETFSITGLAADTTYYFALKVRDEAGNESGLSNNAQSIIGTPDILWVNDGLGDDQDWSNSTTEISANWADAACADGYEYALGTTQGGTDVIAWYSAGSATEVTRTGLSLSDGQTYYWSVRGVLGDVPGTPTTSDGITVDIILPVSQVDPLPEEVGAATFTVTWSGSDVGSGVKYYDVEVSSDGGSTWDTWQTATPLTSSDFTGVNETTYYFRSRAHDNAGNTEAYPEVPDAHTTVRMSMAIAWVNDGLGEDEDWVTSTTSLSANWADAEYVDEYQYAIGTTEGATDVVDWSFIGTQTQVTRGGLTLADGHTYYFSVRSMSNGIPGPATSSDGITVDTVRPSSAVEALAATMTDIAFDVSWTGSDALSGVDRYDIQYKDGDGEWQDWLVGTSLTESVFTGEVDHTYYFRSRAYDNAGNVETYPTDPDATTCLTCAYTYSLQWGSQGSGPGEFSSPRHLAVDALSNVYVPDATNDNVQVFDPQGNFLRAWGENGIGDGQFTTPVSLALDDSGYVYVLQSYYYHPRVQKFAPDGVFVTKWGDPGSGDGEFLYPAAIAVDDSFYVYVSDAGNNRIQKFTSKGAFVMAWGSFGSGDGQLNGVLDLAVGPSGDIYAVDSYNERVQEFTPNGVFVRKWGSSGTGDGQFLSPPAIAVDGSGYVYVADSNANRIQRFTPDGRFLTKWGSPGTGDGELDMPYGVAVGLDGSVFVSDLGNYRIQKFTATCP
jgi:hypothetical protein